MFIPVILLPSMIGNIAYLFQAHDFLHQTRILKLPHF